MVRDSLPSIHRLGLVTLPECVLSEKTYFCAVTYRSPSQDQTEFDQFTMNFELILSRMNNESPFCIIISDDFNCRLTYWWQNDNESNEGRIFESITADLGPTNVMGDSKSCIDLFFTDQPNLIIKSGVHPSLHSQCHHRIVYGKLSVSSTAPHSYTRRIWHYSKADFINILKSIDMFNWHEQLGRIT